MIDNQELNTKAMYTMQEETRAELKVEARWELEAELEPTELEAEQEAEPVEQEAVAMVVEAEHGVQSRDRAGRVGGVDFPPGGADGILGGGPGGFSGTDYWT